MAVTPGAPAMPGPPVTPSVGVVVPTLGRSPYLFRCLQALRRSAQAYGGPVEILLVAPRELSLESLSGDVQGLVDRVVRVDRGGFSVANNAALGVAEGELLATVNDDAVVDRGWLKELVAAMDDARVVAVQGVNRRLSMPEVMDGWGIGWNRRLQAVQLGHGRPLAEAPCAPVEVFGVSATAALYRRSALGDPRRAFDPELFAYYEDVDLAARLRAAGGVALCRPSARADHAGSTTSGPMKLRSRRWIHGHRHLVLARWMGRSFWFQWPRVWARDGVDALRCLVRGDVRGAAGVVAGWGNALKRLPRYGHLGASRLDLKTWTGSTGKPYDAELPSFRDR